MTPFIGVRISWLILARNSLLARLASSAASLALSSSLVRSSTRFWSVWLTSRSSRVRWRTRVSNSARSWSMVFVMRTKELMSRPISSRPEGGRLTRRLPDSISRTALVSLVSGPRRCRVQNREMGNSRIEMPAAYRLLVNMICQTCSRTERLLYSRRKVHGSFPVRIRMGTTQTSVSAPEPATQ